MQEAECRVQEGSDTIVCPDRSCRCLDPEGNLSFCKHSTPLASCVSLSSPVHLVLNTEVKHHS